MNKVAKKTVTRRNHVKICKKRYVWKGLFADESILAGQVFYRIENYRFTDRPTYQSIQIGEKSHIIDEHLVFMNHSCNPNSIIDTETLLCIATRDIQAGEEIKFFYPSTEWEMDQPFYCNCGHPDCIGIIRGAKYLVDTPIKILERYFFNKHIQDMLIEEYCKSIECYYKRIKGRV